MTSRPEAVEVRSRRRVGVLVGHASCARLCVADSRRIADESDLSARLYHRLRFAGYQRLSSTVSFAIEVFDMPGRELDAAEGAVGHVGADQPRPAAS